MATNTDYLDGKEKAFIARYGSLAVTILTAVAVFVSPDTTAGHFIPIAVALLTSLATALGVQLIPNTPASLLVKTPPATDPEK